MGMSSDCLIFYIGQSLFICEVTVLKMMSMIGWDISRCLGEKDIFGRENRNIFYIFRSHFSVALGKIDIIETRLQNRKRGFYAKKRKT